MLVAWTTVANQADAERIAASVVAARLAACVQIDGPISSHYCWEGRAICEREYRLCFKFLDSHAQELEQHMLACHPYDTPEWVVLKAEHVGEKYLCWAKAGPTNPPL